MRIKIPHGSAGTGMDLTIELDDDQTMELYAELKAAHLEDHYREWLAKQAFPDNVTPIRPVNPLGLACEEDHE
jgi:uncharacterized protein (DUF3820 family)